MPSRTDDVSSCSEVIYDIETFDYEAANFEDFTLFGCRNGSNLTKNALPTYTFCGGVIMSRIRPVQFIVTASLLNFVLAQPAHAGC